MKLSSYQAVLGSALLLLADQASAAAQVHRHAHHQHSQQQQKRHSHGHHDGSQLRPWERGLDDELVGVGKRAAACSFPSDPDLVPVTPGAANGGWAMSPDQPCTPGTWCPVACKPGKVMAQWDPNSTYTYPVSMYGGAWCGADGVPVKPFDNQPFCVDGTGTVSAVNLDPQQISFCQTVLPGNEAMLIPTVVAPGATVTLAIPGPTYWCGTAAHYYINPPGVGAEGCIWGDPSKPIGNWAPYVAGGNTVAGGLTFVKIGYNPIWTSSALSSVKPTYGVRITCPGGGCNGLTCEIDPSKNPIGVVTSPNAAVGAGDAAFCVVTVPAGGHANIEVFDLSGKVATSAAATTSSSTAAAATSTTAKPTSTSATGVSSTAGGSSTGPPASSYTPTGNGGVFFENGTSTTTSAGAGATASGGESSGAAAATTSKKGEAPPRQQGGAAVVGLVIAFVVAACLY